MMRITFALCLAASLAACNGSSDRPFPSTASTGGGSASSAGGAGSTSTASSVDVDAGDLSNLSELEALVRLVNARRAEGADCGSEGTFPPAPPLAEDAILSRVAQDHSADMVEHGYFSHTGRDGSQPWDRMTAAGYSWRAAGENIAAGSSTAEGAMNQWMNSDGHCANIMNPDFTEIGVGVQGVTWTQVFGRPG